MSARHYNTREETARLDALVMRAFETGGPPIRVEDLHDKIGRRNIDGLSLGNTLSRLRRQGKLTYDRKTGWSKP